MSSPPGRFPFTPTFAQPFALLNDEPVTDETLDLLGANRAAAQLTGLLVASRNATPFTLAVDAGWGMGKSSLMRLVDVRLSRFPGVHTVWYNAWTSTGADALEGLIKSVLGQVDPSILRRTLRRFRDGGALTALLRALTVIAAGPLGVAGMVDELWKRLSVDAGARNGMRDALREMVGEWTAAPGAAPGRLLVIFIDDLDRCSEETFLAVCEAVKVYLDVPGLAFVIGCDRSAIGPGGLLPDLSPAGAAFVEKIFQTSYRIPAPSGQEIQAYIRSCAQLAGIDHLLDGPLVELLAYRAARNPRRVKRLLNGLLLEASLNPVWAGISPEAVIRTLLLQYLYPDFHRMMTAPAGPGDDGDVVREFLTYRQVRTRLWSPAPLADDERVTVASFLGDHSLPPLGGNADHGAVLTDLEARLPVGFPALANDPAFVSLVDELVALPESDVVRRRLREGAEEAEAVPPVPPDPVESSVDYGDTGASLRPVPAYPTYPAYPGYGYPQQSVSPALDEDEGEFVIDYSPPAWYTQSEPEQSPAVTPMRPRPRVVVAGFPRTGGNRLVRSLTADGEDVVWADSPEGLAEELADDGDLALLICRVDFAEGRGSGFDLVRDQRARGYAGPVIFYSPRITPTEQAVARELTAVLTDELDTVLTRARELLTPEPPPSARSGPPGHPSGGRPR